MDKLAEHLKNVSAFSEIENRDNEIINVYVSNDVLKSIKKQYLIKDNMKIQQINYILEERKIN
tara:strand:- start:307 stop:495 length:189 start_codon:yes stop_codon:yes gene_type:complete